MTTWQDKLDEFLKPWRQMPELVGVLACGSFVTGRLNPRSDLDVHLVLSETVDWRERGNRIVDGLLIEYFANPPRQIRAYFAEDHDSYSIMAATQFLTGQVILDTTGDVMSLREEARRWAHKQFPAQPGWMKEMDKYSLWDTADNLADAAERGAPDFPFLYSAALQQLFACYARHLGYPIPGADKIYVCLTSEAARAKYLQPEFPDPEFATAFAAAMTETIPGRMLQQFQSLGGMVLHRMNGFEINGWSLRTPVER